MKYWPFEDAFSFSPTRAASGGPLDQKATFTPDVGPTITRRRTTAVVEMWSLSVIVPDRQALSVFEGWFNDDLQSGVLPFVWLHPTTRAVSKFKFTSSYAVSPTNGDWLQVSFDVMVLPGALWFAPYVIPKTAKPPAWVADYAASVFGVNGVKGVVGDLAAVSGTFDVLVTFTDGGVQFQRLTFAADIPSAAPSGVASYAAFA